MGTTLLRALAMLAAGIWFFGEAGSVQASGIYIPPRPPIKKPECKPGQDPKTCQGVTDKGKLWEGQAR